MKFLFQDYISIKIHKADLLMTSLVKAKLEPFNLAPEQNLIMMLLWETDGLTQQQLGEKLNKDKTNIARMAASLEKKGFVTRKSSEKDRRLLHVFLTPRGQELGKQVVPVAEKFNETVCKGLTSDELQQLEQILLKITRNVQSSM